MLKTDFALAGRILIAALGLVAAGRLTSAQEAIFVAPNGDVGFGTTTPQAPLHAFGPADQDSFLSFGPSPAAGPAFNIGYGGGSLLTGAAFLNVRPAAGATGPRPALYFMTANSARIIIDKDGNIGFGANVESFDPTQPLHHTPTNARLEGGIWTNGSSRDIKHDIRELAVDDALAAFSQLTPVRYRPNASPQEEALGFIAEDVPDLVAYGDRKGLSPMDFVAVLTKVVQEQQKRLDALAAALATRACDATPEGQGNDRAAAATEDHE
jgi:hypothetical protein